MKNTDFPKSACKSYISTGRRGEWGRPDERTKWKERERETIDWIGQKVIAFPTPSGGTAGNVSTLAKSQLPFQP